MYLLFSDNNKEETNMNAITKALSDLKFKIPDEVLRICFNENQVKINQIISLDERIMSQIIRPRILIDANLVGGVSLDIQLADCNIRLLGNLEYIVEVPKTLTNNKSIITPLSIVANTVYTSSVTGGSSGSAMLSTGMDLMNSFGTQDVIQTSRLELIGENTIVVSDPSLYLQAGVMKVMIENSTNLENIHPRSYIRFSELVTLGVKSYIYNKLKIKLDKGYIYGGHELSSISDIVESYSDAEELYTEFLTSTWAKVAFINDGDSMERFVKSMIGYNI